MSSSIFAQSKISGVSRVQEFQLEKHYERGLPPNLFADLQFADENGNGILEANENAILKLVLTNKGKGTAQGLQVRIIVEDYKSTKDLKLEDLKLDNTSEIPYLLPDKSYEINLPISASMNINTAEYKLKIKVLEHFGYDMDPAYLVLNTYAYQKPKLAFSGLEIVDYGEGTGSLVEDGQLQAGELVKAKIFIQNIGQNVAEDVQYHLKSLDPNIFIDGGAGRLGDMAIGEVKSFWVTISPNKRVHANGNLPLYLTANNIGHYGSITSYQLPLALNQKAPEAQILEVKADIEKLQKQVARFEYTSNKFTANVGKIINIREVPVSDNKRKNSVAVVIGIENYQELPPAPYAENDARIIKDYFRDAMGIEKVVIYTSKEAKGFFFDDVFNPDYGELQKAIIKGETDLFVFYSGHGVPSKNGEQIFLFPTDGRIARMDMQGYNLNKFYTNLERLGAKSVNVFLDACFSGASKRSEKIQTENLVAIKGIRVKPNVNQPWLDNPDFSVFTSSSYDETSLALDASQTGLFTYYICTGLLGEADLNGNNQITMGELYRYVKTEVMKTSKKISGVQTPEFHGNAEQVLVTF